MEALLGLLFANLFWVGLWDLLDTTIFPFDSSYAMLLLVRRPAAAVPFRRRGASHSLGPLQVVLGITGMYFTNALYQPEPEKQQAPLAAAPSVSGVSYGTIATSGYTQTVSPATQTLSAADLETARKGPRLTMEQVIEQLEVNDTPCAPPRFEPWRLCERIVANCAAVFVWVGVWDQIDMNVLPLQCSYNACGRCSKYGQFPCAWYKIGFVILGVVGQYFTRNLYVDSEVTYAPRKQCPCCGVRLRQPQQQAPNDGL